jgi:hypothetical protein
MQAENREPTLSDVLTELRTTQVVAQASLKNDVEKLDYKLEVSQSAGEHLERLATSLIAGATISIIAGVILLLLRQQ